MNQSVISELRSVEAHDALVHQIGQACERAWMQLKELPFVVPVLATDGIHPIPRGVLWDMMHNCQVEIEYLGRQPTGLTVMPSILAVAEGPDRVPVGSRNRYWLRSVEAIDAYVAAMQWAAGLTAVHPQTPRHRGVQADPS